MASIQTLGLGSGIDLSSMLDQLKAAEQSKLEPIALQSSNNKGKISAFGAIKSALDKLQEAALKLNSSTAFTPLASTVSGTGVTAAVGSGASAGSYQIRVDALAKAQSVATQGVASRTDALTGSGTLTLGVGSDSLDIAINADSSLEDVRSAINSSGADVTASIVNTGDATAPYRLMLTSKTTGTESEISMSFAGTGELSTLLSDSAAGGTVSVIQAAQDAQLSVNGIDITSQTNTVSEAIQGVTLKLDAVGSEQTLDVSRDTEAVKENVQAFVDAYNAYAKVVDTNTAYNEDSTLSGKLLGDSSLRTIENRLRSTLNTPESGEFAALADLGIKLKPDGMLEVDDAKLSSVIEQNPEELEAFFVGSDYKSGMAGRLNQTLDSIVGYQGILETVTSGLEKSNTRLQEDYGKMEERIDAVIERYRVQFAAMDSLVGEMNSMMSYLNQQFEAMAAQLSD